MLKAKKVWVVVSLVGAVLLIAILVAQHLLNADTYRGRIETALSDSLGRPVQLGHLQFSIWSGSLLAEALAIADDPAYSGQPFLTAKDVRIGVEMGPLLLHRTLHITGVTIDEPKITLLRAENGTWNYSSIGSAGKRKTPSAESQNLLPNLTVGKIEIADGTVTLGTAGQTDAQRVFTSLNLSVKDFSFTKQFPLTADGKLPGGGSVSIQGNAGPINEHDASLTPISATVSLKQASLVDAGLVAPSQGISGVADLDCTVVSDGQTAKTEGTLHLTQLKLAQDGSPSAKPVDARFAIEQNLQSLAGTVQSATVQVGKVALTITGTYRTQGSATVVQIKVNGSNMPVDDLVAFLPSLGVKLPAGSRLQGGALTANLDVSGPTTGLVISGPIHLANAQLAGFDLGQKLAAIRSLTGAKTGSDTTIQTLDTKLQYGPAGTRTDNLTAVVTGLGSATGGGSISPGGALNYQLVVKFDASGAGGFATQAMGMLPGLLGSAVGQAAKDGIPVSIGGTTSNPTFTPNMSKVFTGALGNKSGAQSNPLGGLLGGLIRR